MTELENKVFGIVKEHLTLYGKPNQEGLNKLLSLIQEERRGAVKDILDMVLSKFDLGCNNCWKNIDLEKTRLVEQIQQKISNPTKQGGEMSQVTNAILTYSIIEDDLDSYKHLNAVNKFFEGTRGFVHIDNEREAPVGWYRGTKMMETNIALGAFNYLDEDGLIDHIYNMKWKEPENVQLLLCRQEEDRFMFVIDGIPTSVSEEKGKDD